MENKWMKHEFYDRPNIIDTYFNRLLHNLQLRFYNKPLFARF